MGIRLPGRGSERGGVVSKRVQATISSDLFTHILALKEYGNYKSLSALVEESLEQTISEYSKFQSFRDYQDMRTHDEQA
nr:MAG: antitoxin [Bacteriophage sp.]DAV54528.1 MAG TPA: Ribbon-helix-helix protein, copG family [Caudoviricetes sp.]